MRKERTLFIMGFWVALLPFLGFPNNWRKILFIITGLLLIYLSYLFYLETKRRIKKTREDTENFVDNIGSSE
ncbi:TPA: hypothetical protein DIC38_03120 [Candidatus Nomurabacteria bacterium]|nr:MAG: hypothetical protein O210_OD1C00001G0159 [Parcubacteria bacterium RAAC4_OD1_1]HCY26644.1 hypothetical protein [Candidatus Nomurabacteria bacterium]